MSPGWWNGRHWRLKISWPHGRTGSSPVPGMEKSEFDTIRFWLFYFLQPKELQILPCNVKEHIGPNNKAFFAIPMQRKRTRCSLSFIIVYTFVTIYFKT